MKKLLALLLLGGVALAGIAVWVSLPRTLSVSEDLFTYAAIERGDLQETVSANGVLQPRDLMVIGSEIPGTVLAIHAKINDHVRPGQELLQLDGQLAALKAKEAAIGVATAKAALAQALALQEAAVLILRYQRDLEVMGGFRSEREEAEVKLKAANAGIDMARARLQAADNGLEQAQLGVKRTHIKVPGAAAPDSATYLVLDRKAQIGQNVSPQLPTPLFTLAVALRHMEIHTDVVEGDIGRLRAGQPVSFTVNSYSTPDTKHTGVVREIRPLPNNVKGAVYYNAVIEVENKPLPQSAEWQLRPGMTASVDVVLRVSKNAWKVPQVAFDVRMDEAYQTDAARAQLVKIKRNLGTADWRTIWLWDAQRASVWPVAVRIADSARGQLGVQQGDYLEALAWDPDFALDPQRPPRVITLAPPARMPGMFDRPVKLKLS